MIAEKHIRHYNNLHGKLITKTGLQRFYDALKKDIDSKKVDAHVPYGVDLLAIEKRIATALPKITKPVKLEVQKVKLVKIELSKNDKKPLKKLVGETPKVKLENKRPSPQKESKTRSKATAVVSTKSLSGLVSASTLSGIKFRVLELTDKWKALFQKLYSDSQLMIWGVPGSGKTVLLLEFAQYLASQLNEKVLYVANEEFARSTFSEKLKQFNIGHKNLMFAKKIDDKIISQFDVIFFDSINSLGMSLKEYKAFRERHTDKLFVLIVQSTKDGDFRGGKDWEHEVDIAGEVRNRKLILRKNRLDPHNSTKAEKLLTADAIAEGKKRMHIRQEVKNGLAKPKTKKP